jgi:hypothetical protein
LVAEKLVAELDCADKRSDGFRYPTDRRGDIFDFPIDRWIDPANVLIVMQSLANFFECMYSQFELESSEDAEYWGGT